MSVFKYTDKVQQLLGLQCKAEPWLHINLVRTSVSDKFPYRNAYRGISMMDSHYYNKYKYVIYVWDTRQVIEQGECNAYASLCLYEARKSDVNWKFVHIYDHNNRGSLGTDIKALRSALVPAEDNGQPLIGGKHDEDLNKYFADGAELQAKADKEKADAKALADRTWDGKRPLVFRYTPEIQQATGCKVKPEPWLHCYLTNEGTGCVFVWDTRQIVGNLDKVQPPITGELANDNHKTLVGPMADKYDIELAMCDNPKELQLARKCKQYLDKLKDSGTQNLYGLSAGRLSIKDGKLWSSMWGNNEDDNDGSTVYAVAITKPGAKPSRFLRSSGNAFYNRTCNLIDDQTHRPVGMARIIDILPPRLAIQKYGALTGWSLK